ncbi:MAG: arylsulfatase [Pseudarcicella sp.]|nr:arylsulfatase [Pseudarcicella sp.]
MKTKINLLFIITIALILGNSCSNDLAEEAVTKADSNSARTISEKPNIIFILADDLGYGDISCFGQKKFQTPNIDLMATQGVKLTNYYSSGTVCAPSRCSMLTGLHTGHSTVRGNSGTTLLSSDVCIASLLKNNGYTTGMYGKWGLGDPSESGSPEKMGWDEFLGYTNHGAAHSYYVNSVKIKRKNENFTTDTAISNTICTHNLIMDYAMKFITKNKENPFFLYLPVTLPHASMVFPTPESKAPFFLNNVSKFTETPWYNTGGSYTTQLTPNAATAAMITQLDFEVGKIIKKLADLGLSNNTYIVFTSDNGPHKEAGRSIDFFDSNGPYRGLKRDFYDGGIRVPFIAWAPGTIPANSTITKPRQGTDLFATFLNMAGATIPSNIDSKTILPALKSPTTAGDRSYLYWESFDSKKMQAVLKNNFKLIRTISSTGASTYELYNLVNNPGETTNVASQNPTIVNDLKAIMNSARTNTTKYNLPNTVQ